MDKHIFNIPVILSTSWSLRGTGRATGVLLTLFGCRAEVRAGPPAFEDVEWRSHLRRLTQSAYMKRKVVYGYFSLSHVIVV